MNQEQNQPWWKFGHVWLVIAGPAVVVVASFITLYLAIIKPDFVVNGYGEAQPSLATRVTSDTTGNMAPAQQARNHAATGVAEPAQP